ncbi:AMP-binding protein [Longivirga aurantiaca]|uniref:Long-chain-fatty-acid--CoA ligase n=1 Tax=Longivirga aurantiaca TaxID=1837743 RepID=A0ABW1SXB3_9ACTN
MTPFAEEAAARPWLHHYPAGVPADIETVASGSLGDELAAAAAEYGDARAFTMVMPNGMNGHLTFADVDRLSDQFALYLREVVGLQQGDRVAVQLPNCLAYPVVAFGTLKAGCVVVNTNPLYTGAELRRQLLDADVSLVVGADVMAATLAEVVPDLAGTPVVLTAVSDFFPGYVHGIIRTVQKVWNRTLPPVRFAHTRLPSALSLGAATGADAAAYRRELNPGSLACLQYTGGTTGVSKGAMLTHGNLMANGHQMLGFAGEEIVAGRETVLTALPCYHVFAFTVNLLGFHLRGAHNILIPNPRPLSNLKRAFENYPITWVTGVNTLFHGLTNEEWFLDNPPPALCASISGGMALHSATAQRWQEVTGSPVVEGYGLTESSPGLTFNPLDGGARPGTVGVPLPSTVVRPTRDDGAPAALGEPGELWARGPQIMAGYWRRPEETELVLSDGWLRTGDIGVMDDDGFVRIVDRSKDVIIVSGFNVFPNEVEDALASHAGVEHVAVVGVEAGERGERVRAVVVRRDPAVTADELRAHAATLITGYKVPTEFVFADSLPTSPIGKILRKDVRTQFADATPEPMLAAARTAR